MAGSVLEALLFYLFSLAADLAILRFMPLMSYWLSSKMMLSAAFTFGGTLIKECSLVVPGIVMFSIREGSSEVLKEVFW
jgi:hypothetical protein